MTFLLVLFRVLYGEVLNSTDEITMVSSRYHPNLLSWQRLFLASKRPYVRTWGRQTCFLARAPS